MPLRRLVRGRFLFRRRGASLQVSSNANDPRGSYERIAPPSRRVRRRQPAPLIAPTRHQGEEAAQPAFIAGMAPAADHLPFPCAPAGTPVSSISQSCACPHPRSRHADEDAAHRPSNSEGSSAAHSRSRPAERLSNFTWSPGCLNHWMGALGDALTQLRHLHDGHRVDPKSKIISRPPIPVPRPRSSSVGRRSLPWRGDTDGGISGPATRGWARQDTRTRARR